ncbi:hypothetical protein IAT40_002042 [Kwoniella sp. CBS 6097]
MANPPPGPGAGVPPPASTGAASNSPRPSGSGNSQMTINTILQNLPNLFGMHAKGNLSELQINQLRQLMHTHYRHVTASAISTGRPNPLLSLPPAIDPTMPWNGKPPIISRDAYLSLIEKTTAHLQEHMAKRAQEQAQAALAGGVNGESSSASSSQQGQTSTSIMQPSGPGTPPIPQAGVTGQQQQQQQQQAVARPPQQGIGTGLGPVSQGQLPPGVFNLNHLKDLLKSSPEVRQEWFAKDPNRLAAYNLSLKYWGAKQQQQQQLANAGGSGVPIAGPSRSTPPPPAPSQTQAQTQPHIQAGNIDPQFINPNATASPVIVQNSAPLPMPTTINPSSLQTPPITPPVQPVPQPAQSASSPSSSTAIPPPEQPPSQPAPPPSITYMEPPPNASGAVAEAAPAETTTETKMEAVGKPDTDEQPTGDVEMKTSQPEPDQAVEPSQSTEDKTTEASKGESASTANKDVEKKAETGAESSTAEASSTKATVPESGVDGDPALPSAAANTESTPAFATALPDPKAFALKPPPPPPEPEHIRRKRKWREFVDELVPGMEMEVGIDQVLGDLLDELLEEGFKGAVRLAKHRGSDKVELKDMAYFVDQHWDMAVPGFDALGHSHRHIHVAPEKERRRGKAVNPNQAAYAAFVKANGKSQAQAQAQAQPQASSSGQAQPQALVQRQE